MMRGTPKLLGGGPLRAGMRRAIAALAAVFAITTFAPTPAGAQQQAARGITAEEVRTAIDKGVRYLQGQQSRTGGNWDEWPSQPGGVTSLATLALLSSGVPATAPSIQRALAYLRRLGEPDRVYATSLQTMVFCLAEPEKDRLLIRRNVSWLERAQLKGGEWRGSWGYVAGAGRGDNSNTQFALLALHEADRVGVEVNEGTWRSTLAHFLRRQTDGAWYYDQDRRFLTGSMTSAGIACTLIAAEKLPDFQGEARLEGERILCCGDSSEEADTARRAIEAGLLWLGDHFSVYRNPSTLDGGRGPLSTNYILYYLYALERVGRLTGNRFIQGSRRRYDWYREGSEMLVKVSQDPLSGQFKGVGHSEDQPVISTSLALLFLAKGRRPVVLSRLAWGNSNDWNRHRRGVQQLTLDTEKRWKRDLSWQTIQLQTATLDDLLETPVLLISGRGAFTLDAEQKTLLRGYVEQGGFLFVENGCEDPVFERTFLAVMRELFEASPEPLPADHPLWFAEEPVTPSPRWPLLGINACCRTSIVYCPRPLSCHWELGGQRGITLGETAAADVETANRIGVNVLAYATNRQLRYRLDTPQVSVLKTGPENALTALRVGKLAHAGGSDDAPNAVKNLLAALEKSGGVRTERETPVVAPQGSNLLEFPILFMHGRRGFRHTEAERRAIAEHLDRGGFLLIDSICASEEFTNAVRREMQAWRELLPGSRITRIEPNHPLLTDRYGGFPDLSTVQVREPQTRVRPNEPLAVRAARRAPELEALELEGRVCVVFSPLDLSCALENVASLQCRGYLTDDAARLGVNLLLFALQQ